MTTVRMSGEEAKSFAQCWSNLLSSANDDEFLHRRRRDAQAKRREASAIERELALSGYDVRTVLAPEGDPRRDAAAWQEEDDLSCDACADFTHGLC